MALSQAEAAETTVIAAFGDSLFAGYGLAPEESLPAQLEQKLLADGYHVKIINDGVSGDTTAGGLTRLSSVLAQKPDIVFLELGANDMLRAGPPADIRNHLDQMLARFSQEHLPVLVFGQKAPASLGTAYREAFDPIFSDLAKKYDFACYPFFFDGVWGRQDLLQADGIHPNAEGVKVIVGRIYPSVTAMLRK